MLTNSGKTSLCLLSTLGWSSGIEPGKKKNLFPIDIRQLLFLFRILPNSGISASKWDLLVFRKRMPSCMLHAVFLDKQTGISLPQIDRPSGTRLITRCYRTIALNMFCHPIQHLTDVFASSMQNCRNDYCWFLACKGKGFLFLLSLFQGWIPRFPSGAALPGQYLVLMKRSSVKCSWACNTTAS